MSIELPETDHHIVISADSHCGADLRGYKPYLEKKYHDDFEEWAASEEAAKQQEALFAGRGRSTRNVGIDGDPELDADKNYSSERRLKDQQEDGVVALFFSQIPNHHLPHRLQRSLKHLRSDNFEHRWAGLRAHNRWLKDFVDEAPIQRAGIAQIFLGDVEGSVKEIEWAAENGLRGGILVPGAPPDSPFEPLYSASYEPIWAAAAANNMTLNHHVGGATPILQPFSFIISCVYARGFLVVTAGIMASYFLRCL